MTGTLLEWIIVKQFLSYRNKKEIVDQNPGNKAL